MIGQRWIVAFGVVVLSGCGGSELRRAMNDVIDQREAGAAEQAEIYESFEVELTEELTVEWGATPNDGCPELEDLPPSGPGFPGLSVSALLGAPPSARDREMQQARDEAQQAREAAWVRNVPGEQCRCLQQTIVSVRRALELARIDPSRFEEERAELAELTEEELPLAAPMIRGSADQFSPDGVLERVAGWKSRRYGEDGEPGWQSAAEQVDRAFGAMVPPSLLIFGSCDRF